MSIMQVRAKYGNWIPIRVLKNAVDQKFNPKSANAQSGIAVDEAISAAVGDINTVLASVVEGGEE